MRKLLPLLLLTSLFFTSLSAQITSSSLWTWMKGSSVYGTHGTYGTKGVASSLNTPGGRTGALSWKDNSGNFWIMGGNGFASSGYYAIF